MAQMFPELTHEQLDNLESSAEAKVYYACRDHLPDTVIVQHSLPFVMRRGFRPVDGEADFVLFDRNNGILLLEVKGGGVRLDPRTQQWTSISRSGAVHPINDPFQQAMKAKKALRNYLDAEKGWSQVAPNGCTYGHAVFFPDVGDIRALVQPEAPSVLIGSSVDLASISNWVSGVFQFWQGQEGGNAVPGKRGEAEFTRIFCKEIIVRPLLSVVVAEDEKRHLQLTDEQAQILRLLHRRQHAAVSGGAGTGKTLIAIRKARELAEQGKKTLFLCYNRALGEQLKRVVQHENLWLMNFHQYCKWRVDMVRDEQAIDLFTKARAEYRREDAFDVQWPYALALAIEADPQPFDAIVIDEGQDFKEDFWLPIEMSLVEADGVFFVFYDENQSIYTKTSGFPFTREESFPLTVNCRNTRTIHDSAYAYYTGEPVDPPPVAGQEVDYLVAAGMGGEAKCVGNLVVRLIQNEGVRADDIVVLIGNGSYKSKAYGLLEAGYRLPKPAVWAVEEIDFPNGVTVDTVARFKGLESPVVILWIDETTLRDPSLLYVGLSRAKSKLYVVGEANVIERMQQQVAKAL